MPHSTEQRRPVGDPDGVAKEICSSLSLPAQTEVRSGAQTASARLAAVSALLGSMARRLIEDALLDQLPEVWERRAEQIEAGHPMIGNVPLERISDRDEAAAACRERAALLRRYPDLGLPELGDVVVDALAEQGVAA